MNVSAIKRGSLYLTDDFMQAMSYNVPAQISAFALLDLPEWGPAGMQIASAELGMAAGIVDPNIILPAVFSQYWYNLAAYARQYHAELDYGEDIEDFSEQAFWKCLKRVMPNTQFADMQRFVVAKSTDVLQNTNSVDGNMYMEILLSVNALLTRQSCNLQVSKPAYLQTVMRLPSVDKSMILGGHTLALYDIDKTYYDIANTECVVAKFEPSIGDTFDYNALLLYYAIGDTEQVAGIYFPNAFEQVTSDTWILPKLTKQSDVSVGYSINVRYSGGSAYEYNAANADIGNAMQIYSNWYKAMSRADWQIADLTKVIAKQSLELDKLRGMFDGGFIAGLYNEVNNLKQLVSTTFKGSVSTNKLLELFVQAKQATSKLDLTLMLADLSQTITARDIKVSMPTGAYAAGDVIPVGTSITEVIANMLSSNAFILYTQPTGTIRSGEVSGTLYVAYGHNEAIPIMTILSAGDSGGFVLPAYLNITGDGNDVSYAVQLSTAEYNFQPLHPLANIVNCSMQVQYLVGQAKPGDTDGANKVQPGYLNLSLRIVPVFDMYHSSTAVFETLQSLTSADVQTWSVLSSTNADNVIYAENDYQMLAIPSNVSCPINNVIIGTKRIQINDIDYTIYVAKTRYMTLDTTNLR